MTERLFASSDPARHTSTNPPEVPFGGRSSPLEHARPHLEVVPLPDTGGRPKGLESDRRRREFIRLLASGVGWRDAADQARVKPATVLVMLDSPEFQAVARMLLDQEQAA